MEVIRLSGYDGPEKMEIAKRYLEPKARIEVGLDRPPVEEEKAEAASDAGEAEEAADAAAGEAAGEAAGDAEEGNAEVAVPDVEVVDHGIVTPESLRLTEEAIESLIRWYCRESGVRNLEKHISKVYRKAAYKVVTATEEEREASDWAITEENLEDYVGKPLFTSDRMYADETPVGVVTGLAWTAMGGSVLFIEVTSTNYVHPSERPARGAGRGSKDADEGSDADDERAPRGGGGGSGLRLTGQMGDVMRESAQIALSFARHKLRALEPDNDFFDHAHLHVHVPEGATPKDGPSAGVTMVTGLLSLATNKPVKRDLAMTGELSLTGRVLPIGGVKEKTMAARRSGISTLIFPEANRKDFDELPDHMKEGLDVHYATHYDDVLRIAFDDSDASASVEAK